MPAEQVNWIKHRDLIGQVIDAYLRTAPSGEMRQVVEAIEASLADGDHVVGLL